MLSFVSPSSVSFLPTAPVVTAPRASAAATVRMETVSDLQVLAKKLNPTVGYYNPTTLTDMEFWGQSQEATIGFLRQAELKHGRVAMAAFVGYVLQANGVCWPWALSFDGTTFADISSAGGPADQWDALPTNSKGQILLAIGFFEWWGENSYALGMAGEKHYMRGGKPGYFPSFKEIPHPVPLKCAPRPRASPHVPPALPPARDPAPVAAPLQGAGHSQSRSARSTFWAPHLHTRCHAARPVPCRPHSTRPTRAPPAVCAAASSTPSASPRS